MNEAVRPRLRVATPEDAEAIETLMRASARDLFPRFYPPEVVPSAVRFIATVDRVLLADGTYFVLAVGADAVACGGWSRRDKLFTGSSDQEGAAAARLLDPTTEPARVRAMFVRADWTRRGLGRRILDACRDAAAAEGFRKLALMATLPGEPLYLQYGFEPVARAMIALPDGVLAEGVHMEMDLHGRPPTR